MVKRNFFICIIFLFFTMIFFSGCSSTGEKEEIDNINSKVENEIFFLENNILLITNKYVNDEYLNSNDEIIWEDINNDVQKIGNSLDTIILDFSELLMSKDELNNLREEIDNILISPSENNEELMLKSLSNVYVIIADYYLKISDSNSAKIMNLKSLVLQSYVRSYFLEWDEAKESISLAENKYNEMSDDVDYIQEYSYNLNKVYILLEELKNSINLEEFNLTKVKYINFIEKI